MNEWENEYFVMSFSVCAMFLVIANNEISIWRFFSPVCATFLVIANDERMTIWCKFFCLCYVLIHCQCSKFVVRYRIWHNGVSWRYFILMNLVLFHAVVVMLIICIFPIAFVVICFEFVVVVFFWTLKLPCLVFVIAQ